MTYTVTADASTQGLCIDSGGAVNKDVCQAGGCLIHKPCHTGRIHFLNGRRTRLTEEEILLQIEKKIIRFTSPSPRVSRRPISPRCWPRQRRVSHRHKKFIHGIKWRERVISK